MSERYESRPLEDPYSYTEDGTQVRQYREPPHREVLPRGMDYLGMVFKKHLFEIIDGFTYSNDGDIMKISTIPIHSEIISIDVFTEYCRASKPDLYPELDHLNNMFINYMEQAEEEQARIERRRQSMMATNISEQVGQNIMRARATQDGADAHFSRMFARDSFEEECETDVSAEEVSEEVESPDLSFQPSSRVFMNGHNCDE